VRVVVVVVVVVIVIVVLVRAHAAIIADGAAIGHRMAPPAASGDEKDRS
jgi:hypothetical protein